MSDPDLAALPPEVRERAARWARLPHPVLLLGERGTGKTTLAKWLHEHSGRSGGFVAYSLTQIPAGLEVGVLAGHARGAFTGAVNQQPGLFARAHRGTLLLDELGRASATVQGVLLDLLMKSEVTPLGGRRAVPVDVRLVAATNADLAGLVADGQFAADLLDRFGHYRMHLPPLRHRRSAILPLVGGHLSRAWQRLGRREAPVLSPEVEQIFLRAPWPGNLREVATLCAYLAGNVDGRITVRDLPEAFLATMSVRAGDLEDDQARIRRVIAESAGNHTLAARRLGMSRATLYRRLNAQRTGEPRRPETEEAVPPPAPAGDDGLDGE